MMDRSNFSVGFYPLQEEAAKNGPIRSHALTKEVQERLHVLQRASCKFCAEMTERAAESGERIVRSGNYCTAWKPNVPRHRQIFEFRDTELSN